MSSLTQPCYKDLYGDGRGADLQAAAALWVAEEESIRLKADPLLHIA